jgi:Mg/Co/Ni transporter MgtE
MSLIRNERTKLSATALNSVGIASIAAGFITPLAAVTFGVPGAGAGGPLITTFAALAWLIVGLVLHWLARRLLGGLVE